ncbi:MAG: hypothetical protein IK083_03940 [Abditibacteriota bacterium]|nr:hypothetical protein [Abditibacteriota bacterium]
MKSLTICSPPAGRPGTGRRKAQSSRLALYIFACLCMFFITSCVFASGMAPTMDGSGGNIRFHLSSPGVNCDHDPVTVFGNIYKTPSLDQTYNLVIPIGTSFYYLGVDFEDKDYFVSDQGVYSLWSNDSTYNITYSGVSADGPIIANMTGQSSGDIASFGISGNAVGVDPGHYPTSLTVTDLGSPTQSNVTDTLEVFNLDIWAIDLAEEPGTISLYPDEVYEIDLTAIPADFPHENVCGISVSWLGTLPLPGMGSDSHLYLG